MMFILYLFNNFKIDFKLVLSETEMTKAVARYANDVRKKKFPLKKHSY